MRTGQNDTVRPGAVLIAGPTAGGKSALAVDLARRIGGVVINADSMQVYRELRIITARPAPGDEQGVPHRLYGTVSAREAYSAGLWLEQAGREIDAAVASGRTPVLVGGTGLYFEAVTKGLAPVPDVPGEIRTTVEHDLRTRGLNALRGELSARDPNYAREAAGLDPQRVVRALSVLQATGRSLRDWQGDPPAPAILDQDAVVRMVLMPARDVLYARINRRVDTMIEAGAIDEVRAFLDLDVPPGSPAMKAIGVAQLGAHLRGTLELDEARADMARTTRNYAKRQMTWFRHRMADWPASADHGPDLLERIAGQFAA